MEYTNNESASAGNNMAGANAGVHAQDGQFQAYASAEVGGQTVTVSVERKGFQFGDIRTAFKNFPKTFVAALKRPFTATENFYETATMADSVVMLGVVTATYMLVCLILGLIYLARMAVTYSGLFGYFAQNNVSTIVGWTVGGFFLPFLYVLVMCATIFGVYALVNRLFIKKPFNPQKLMSFTMSAGTGLTICLVLYFFEKLVTITSGITDLTGNVVFYILRYVVGTLVVVIGLLNMNKVIEDQKNYLITIGISVVALTVINYIFNYLFSMMDSAFFAFPM